MRYAIKPYVFTTNCPRWLPDCPSASLIAPGAPRPRWPKRLPDGSRQLSDGSQVAQVAPKWLQGAPRCLPDASSGSQVSPGCSQVVPRSSGGSAQRPPPSLQTSPIDAATCSAKPSSADRLPAKQCEGVPLPPPSRSSSSPEGFAWPRRRCAA